MAEVKPYSDQDAGKKEQVRSMFNNISQRYDFLNHFLSLGRDIHWRRVLVKALRVPPEGRVLDVATGTGDVALEIGRQCLYGRMRIDALNGSYTSGIMLRATGRQIVTID